MNGLKHLNESKPFSQIQNLKFRFRFPSFFNGDLLPNYNRIFERDILIMVVQRLEDIFSIVLNGFVRLAEYTLNDVIAEQRK
jgi:hypothetical protein